MKKQMLTLMLALVLICGCAVHTFAAETVDLQKPGSITLVLEWENEPLDGGGLTMYRVGDIALLDGDYVFVPVEQLADSGVSLEKLDDDELPVILGELSKRKGIEPVTAAISEGSALFADVLPGLYVVTQEADQIMEGFAALRPFLMSLPVHADGQYQYDITAYPKVPLETEPTEPTVPSEPTKPTEPDLPQTGQMNWPVPALAVGGLLFVALGLVLRCSKDRKRHES